MCWEERKMIWIIVIIVVVLLFKNAEKILDALNKHQAKKLKEIERNAAIRERQRSEVEAIKKQEAKKEEINRSASANDPRLSSDDFCEVVADIIAKYSNIVVNDIEKHYENPARKHYDQFPLLYLLYMLELCGINDNMPFVKKVAGYIDKCVDYTHFRDSSNGNVDYFGIHWKLNMANYNELKAKEKQHNEAIGTLFLATIKLVTGETDRDLLEIVGDTLADMEDEINEIWNEENSHNSQSIQNESRVETLQNKETKQTIIRNPSYLSDVADSIVKYANPFASYLSSNYPATQKVYYGFFPLIFIAQIIDLYSLGNNRDFVYELEKEIEKRESYSNYIKDSSSYGNCSRLKMAWDECIWKNYLEFKANENNEKDAIAALFVRIISVTAVNDSQKEIDENMLKLSGVSMRSFEEDMSALLNKYGVK